MKKYFAINTVMHRNPETDKVETVPAGEVFEPFDEKSEEEFLDMEAIRPATKAEISAQEEKDLAAGKKPRAVADTAAKTAVRTRSTGKSAGEKQNDARKAAETGQGTGTPTGTVATGTGTDTGTGTPTDDDLV